MVKQRDVKLIANVLTSPAWFLVVVPLILFRAVVIGEAVWIGNPDRLNSNLKILTFYVRGLASGHLSAWDAHEMLGFNGFALPYTFPNPLTLLYTAFDESSLPIVASWVSIGLLITAGLVTFAFLRMLGIAAFEATVGALCYELSALTLLKLGQNDMSFAVFIVIPAALALIRAATVSRAPWILLGLVVLIASMLHFMFLQKAAYALLLMGTYAVWRSALGRTWSPVLVFACASFVSLVVASPRIIEVARAFAMYSRDTAGANLTGFDQLYEFQNIRPYEILRWLDGSIFGIAPSDAWRLGNNINLTEGFLLSTSAVVPLILIVATVRFDRHWAGLFRRTAQDASFWAFFLLFTILVVEWKPLLHVVYSAFLGIDFTHARILVIGLLPMCALVAIVLAAWRPTGMVPMRLVGLAVAVIVAVAIELFAARFDLATPLADFGLFDSTSDISMRDDALARIAVTGVALLIFAVAMTRPRIAASAHAAIAGLIVVQAFIAADLQINGPQAVSPKLPFYRGDMVMAKSNEFRLPSSTQISALAGRIGPERVVLICPEAIAGGLCVGHVAEAWRLRAADGYYGLGVPRRIRELPWSPPVDLRTISFNAADKLQWPLLGFLNVGKAVNVSTEMFKNANPDGTAAAVERIALLDNPAPVVPQSFLAAAAEPVADAGEAARRIFADGTPVDVMARSFVENLDAPIESAASMPLSVVGTGDRLEVDVSASAGKRLLVLNGLPLPGWHAYIDGVEMPVLPANAVMRAVILPPDAKRVVMIFQPFVRTRTAAMLYLAGAFLLVACLLMVWRYSRRSRARAIA